MSERKKNLAATVRGFKAGYVRGLRGFEENSYQRFGDAYNAFLRGCEMGIALQAVEKEADQAKRDRITRQAALRTEQQL